MVTDESIFKGMSLLTISMNSFRIGQTNSEKRTIYYHRDTSSFSYELQFTLLMYATWYWQNYWLCWNSTNSLPYDSWLCLDTAGNWPKCLWSTKIRMVHKRKAWGIRNTICQSMQDFNLLSAIYVSFANLTQ